MPDKIVSQYRELIQQCTHLQFAVNSGEAGPPEMGHSPFYCPHISEFACSQVSGQAGEPETGAPLIFYILGSMLSSASRALNAAAQAATPSASILLLGDMGPDSDPYAHKRLTFTARIAHVQRDSPQWSSATEGLALRHGETVNTLTALQDFHCFALLPIAGRFVKGFGKAFQLTGDDLRDWVHLRQS